jgi:endonuclease/exonuclease/phosphatase family metal-dependent hydrolase
VNGPAICYPGGGFYGNLLLTRLPVEEVRLIDLAVEGREPRTALDVDLRTDAGLLRVVSTHLGLARRERRLQVDRLLGALQRLRRSAVVVLGDFNEWAAMNQSTRRLDQALGATEPLRTFPAWRPLLPLDRIWVHPVGAVEELRAVVTPLTRRASDHLPLYARLRLGAPGGVARG